MKPKLYIENSIISYLTAHPSRDIITAARQSLTRQWWDEKRFDYELYINATIRNQIERKCRLIGYEPPIICTPEELLGE